MVLTFVYQTSITWTKIPVEACTIYLWAELVKREQKKPLDFMRT